MGKGDRKSKKGKLFLGSYGNKRKRKGRKGNTAYVKLKDLRKWSIEWLFSRVGQFDFTVSIVFSKNSESYKKFGPSITGEIYYTRPHRKSLRATINSGIRSESNGQILFKVILKEGKSSTQLTELLKTGFKNTDIIMLDYYAYKHNKTYFNKNKKKVSPAIKLEVTGSDSILDTLKMQYSLLKMRIDDNDSLIEFEKLQFMAIQNVLQIEEEDKYKFSLEVKQRKIDFDLLTQKIIVRLSNIDKLSQEILTQKKDSIELIVNKEFEKSGINPSKPKELAPYLGIYLYLVKLGISYEDRIVLYSTTPKVVLNFEKFLHIAFRHSPALNIGPLNENKSRIPYGLSEIERLIHDVLQSVESDITNHFENYPNKRFSKFKDELIRFNGDYFEVHINTSGLIETFYNHG